MFVLYCLSWCLAIENKLINNSLKPGNAIISGSNSQSQASLGVKVGLGLKLSIVEWSVY